MARVLCLRRVSPNLLVTCEQAAAIILLISPAPESSTGGKKKKRGERSGSSAKRSDSSKKGGSSTGKKGKKGKKSTGKQSILELSQQMVRRAALEVLFFRLKDYKSTREVIFNRTGPFGGSEADRILADCELAFGRLNLADPANIHGQLFSFDLDKHEDRQLCKLLLDIAYQENKMAPFKAEMFPGCKYGPTGASKLQPVHLPPTWWAQVGPPKHGTLQVNYVAGKVEVKIRERLALKYCRW